MKKPTSRIEVAAYYFPNYHLELTVNAAALLRFISVCLAKPKAIQSNLDGLAKN